MDSEIRPGTQEREMKEKKGERTARLGSGGRVNGEDVPGVAEWQARREEAKVRDDHS